MALDFCWYSTNGGTTNSSLDATCSNFTNVISTENSNTWTVWVNDSIGQIVSDSVSFFKDTIFPTISSLTENPADSPTYSSGQAYKFNATINDTNLDTVIIEFNGINYTLTEMGTNLYTLNITDLSAGTHNYR